MKRLASKHKKSKHKRSKQLIPPSLSMRSEPSVREIGARAGMLIDSIFAPKHEFKIADIAEALEIISDAMTLVEPKMEKSPEPRNHSAQFSKIETKPKNTTEDSSSGSSWKQTLRMSILKRQRPIEESEEIVDPPEQWRETIWRKIQRRVFPSAYREDLQYNALLWERYIKYVEEGVVLPMPPIPKRHVISDTGPR